MARPNILILLTDQERFPTVEEDAAMKRFRREQLPNRQALIDSGISFERHYVGATACSPSRATLLTGFHTLHGVSQTYGFAKTAEDVQATWLERGSVPTLGNWAKEAGYSTCYKGKWHVSHEDIVDPLTHAPIHSVDKDGVRNIQVEQQYLTKNLLSDFGFDDWTGPEPHGGGFLNTGCNRDPAFAAQMVEWLQARDKQTGGDSDSPFLAVCSLLNPHDIVLYTEWLRFKSNFAFSDETVPEIPPSFSENDDLSEKPSAQKNYREVFRELYYPPAVAKSKFSNIQELRKFYFFLHKVVDKHIGEVLTALNNTRFAENTIVIWTSDHGDLLGSHGGMLQKWTNAYEESIRVPFVVKFPGKFSHLVQQPARVTDTLTSHIDIVPTILQLAGLELERAQKNLRKTFSEVHPFPGQNLCPIFWKNPSTSFQIRDVFFVTEDEISRGQRQIHAVQLPGMKLEYDHVRGPCHIEALVKFLGNSSSRRLFKIVRYWDNPERWSHPHRMHRYFVRAGPRRGQLVTRTAPLPDEWELYDLTADPAELKNLARDSSAQYVMAEMSAALRTASLRCRIPRNRPIAARDYEEEAPLPTPSRL
eukprot:TRINITY_DN7089_c0_g1_i1.p1 TRINITY_DN7089_c0_g1~~TRINITY_DN7089_c0_g1_i1.p1  ORF type:complete len:590 (-),score=131.09 TRINITY_DN7089_c0_g1_i1:33-1802(-)